MIEPHLFIFAFQNYIYIYIYISQHRTTGGSWSITTAVVKICHRHSPIWDGDKFFAQEKWPFLSYPKGLFTPFQMEQNNRFFTWFTPNAILGFTSPLPFWGGSVWFWKWRPSSKCTCGDVMLQGMFGRSPLQSRRQYRSNGTMMNSLLKPKMTNGTPLALWI